MAVGKGLAMGFVSTKIGGLEDPWDHGLGRWRGLTLVVLVLFVRVGFISTSQSKGLHEC